MNQQVNYFYQSFILLYTMDHVRSVWFWCWFSSLITIDPFKVRKPRFYLLKSNIFLQFNRIEFDQIIFIFLFCFFGFCRRRCWGILFLNTLVYWMSLLFAFGFGTCFSYVFDFYGSCNNSKEYHSFLLLIRPPFRHILWVCQHIFYNAWYIYYSSEI